MAKTVAKETKATKSFAYVALLSAGFNVLLVLLKYGLSILSGSIALRGRCISFTRRCPCIIGYLCRHQNIRTKIQYLSLWAV